jgi:ubiquinone/menaquinone biosynthesis C-methylase UbiE
MKGSVIEILCCPSCRGRLIPERGMQHGGPGTVQVHCSGCGRRYGHNGEYYDFLNDGGLIYRSRRERFFRSVSARFYTPLTNTMFLFCGGAKSARNEVMSRLKVGKGDTVLETGIGYGENFLWLDRHTGGLALYGLDIQHEMMSHCVRNLQRWGIRADLARADAMYLPYKDSVFDSVFHLGAINLFEDKGKAISEMIRVARPGTHIVIADESEKAGRLFNVFTGSSDRVVPPVDLVPAAMEDITLSIIWRGYGYVIEFDVVK